MVSKILTHSIADYSKKHTQALGFTIPFLNSSNNEIARIDARLRTYLTTGVNLRDRDVPLRGILIE